MLFFYSYVYARNIMQDYRQKRNVIGKPHARGLTETSAIPLQTPQYIARYSVSSFIYKYGVSVRTYPNIAPPFILVYYADRKNTIHFPRIAHIFTGNDGFYHPFNKYLPSFLIGNGYDFTVGKAQNQL